MELNGTVAIVSGGASGLGEATVRRLVARGARVGILDLPSSRGAEVAAALDGAALFVPADVADAAGVEGAVAAVVSAFGRLDVAVTCAGVGMSGRVLDKAGAPHALDLFERIVRVNLVGTFNVLRVAASAMYRNAPNADGERGVVVTTASVAAYDGQVGQVAYAASKGGVVSMTLPVARDLAQWGIRCVTIAPGIFDTPMLATVKEDFRARLAAGVPFPSRLGDPAEYARLVEQIVGSPYLNGEVVRLDGALRMAPR